MPRRHRARNPIPDDTSRTGNRCMEFPPVCKEIPGCEKTRFSYDQDATCLCSGAWGPYNMEIVDNVIIPEHLPAGDYVVGFRARHLPAHAVCLCLCVSLRICLRTRWLARPNAGWDCEESHQIWQSCSDVVRSRLHYFYFELPVGFCISSLTRVLTRRRLLFEKGNQECAMQLAMCTSVHRG